MMVALSLYKEYFEKQKTPLRVKRKKIHPKPDVNTFICFLNKTKKQRERILLPANISFSLKNAPFGLNLYGNTLPSV